MTARGRRRKRRRTSTLSNADLLELASRLGKWGDIFIMMGELEKLGQEAGDFFKLLRKLRRLEPREFLSMINNNPSVIDRLTAFYEGFAIFAEETSNKPLVELSPDEQIELGRRCKDFSLLVTELTDRTA